jgi:hypothetical protein
MSLNKSLLTLGILHLFASPVYHYLMSIMDSNLARGVGFGSQLLVLLLELYHLYFWMNCLTFDMVVVC